jgi:hypothetical protein
VVRASPDGGVVADVAASVVDHPSEQITCTPSNSETDCDWYGLELKDPGSYILQVSAAGYQTVDVPVSLTLFSGCCGGPSLRPDVVMLSPGDAGP